MTKYLFIETRDPFESTASEFVEGTATALRQRGNPVTVFLVQNGVLGTRKSANAPHFRRLADAEVALLADEFSLRERGIQSSDLRSGIRVSTIEKLVDALIEPQTKAIWH
jgi:predicted peroxiredoxin